MPKRRPLYRKSGTPCQRRSAGGAHRRFRGSRLRERLQTILILATNLSESVTRLLQSAAQSVSLDERGIAGFFFIDDRTQESLDVHRGKRLAGQFRVAIDFRHAG